SSLPPLRTDADSIGVPCAEPLRSSPRACSSWSRSLFTCSCAAAFVRKPAILVSAHARTRARNARTHAHTRTHRLVLHERLELLELHAQIVLRARARARARARETQRAARSRRAHARVPRRRS